MASAWERGRAAWPEIDVPLEAFDRYLAERDIGDATAHAGDLYLACACALGAPTALSAFHKSLLSQTAEWVRRFDPSPAFADDLSSIVHEKLLVAAPGRLPKITEYAGRGSLNAWVRMVTVRAAIDLIRSTRPAQAEELPRQLAAQSADPELQYLKQKYQPLFTSALDDGLHALDSEQRSLLRLHLLDGLSFEQMSAIVGASKATVARRTLAAREQVFASIKQALQAELGVDTEEFQSLIGLVRSQIEVSIEKQLRRLDSTVR
jgi:RNA polymerase sigma-70 factor (ECF subfamily)